MLGSYAVSARSAAIALVVALVAGNSVARGGVDTNAVALSCAAAAALLLLSTGRIEDRVQASPLVVGLGASVLVIGFQLVPLPPDLVRIVSSAASEPVFRPHSQSVGWRPLSLDPGTTALELAKAATFAAVAAAAGVLATARRDTLLRILALSGVAVVAVQVGSVLLLHAPLVQPRVTFVNPNHLAGFLQLAAWPALGFALRARGPARAGWLAAFAATSAGVFLSLSRGGIAAFFLAATIFVLLRLRANPRRGSREEHSPRSRGVSVVAVGIGATLAVVAWLALGNVLKELGTIGDESTTALKLGMWPLALAMIRDFPVTGIGRGAFATVYPSYKWEPVQRTFTHVENEWLQLPLELGVVVGVAVIGLFAWAWVAAARRRDLSRPMAGALAGSGALVVHNLFDFSLEVPGVAIPFAIVLAIAARHMPALQVRRGVVRLAAVVLLALGGLGVALHAAHPLERDAAKVVEAPSANEAIAAAQVALVWHPADWVPPAAVGAKLAAERRCAEAMPWLSQAMRRSPTAPEPHRTAGYCLAAAGQGALAKREYRLAFAYGDLAALAEASVLFPGPGALLEVAPDTPQALMAAARILKDRPVEAAEAYRRAWESFRVVNALAPLASAQLALADPEGALSTARLLQAEGSRQPGGYVLASRALDALGRSDEALAELELGAARLPGNLEVLGALGAKHLSKRRFSQAKAVFDGIVAREPGPLATKYAYVARALEGQGRYQEALRQYQNAREVVPLHPGALFGFARCAAAVGRHDEAIAALEKTADVPGVDRADLDAKIAAVKTARSELAARRAAAGLR